MKTIYETEEAKLSVGDGSVDATADMLESECAERTELEDKR